MSKNKPEAPVTEPTGEDLTKEQQVDMLDEQIQKHEATIAEFSSQLKALRVDLQEEDELITKKVNEELDGFPDSSPKGLLEKVYKLNLPKRGALQQSIDKVTIAIEHTRGKKNKLTREKSNLEEAIKEEGLNTLTERLCEIFKSTLDEYLKFEDSFLSFKEKAVELGILDRMYFNRVDNEKFPKWYREVFGLSLLSPASLRDLTAHTFVTTVQGIGPEGEGGNPLKARKFIREETKPIHRDITGKTEEPEGPNSAAANKLSEIFEAGPRVPTYD